jgi:hypothetical protein
MREKNQVAVKRRTQSLFSVPGTEGNFYKNSFLNFERLRWEDSDELLALLFSMVKGIVL